MISGQSHVDLDLLSASGAPIKIFLHVRAYGRHRHFRFVANPAPGALEIPVDLKAEIADALTAELRRLQPILYLQLAKLYSLKLRFQLESARFNFVRYLKRNLLQLDL